MIKNHAHIIDVHLYLEGRIFTVNLLQRHDNDLSIREINLLRDTVRQVRKRHPFQIDAWVVLPNHLHCVWSLRPGDSDFSMRWRLIKSGFSRALPKTERLSIVRRVAGERGIWQRHYGSASHS